MNNFLVVISVYLEEFVCLQRSIFEGLFYEMEVWITGYVIMSHHLSQNYPRVLISYNWAIFFYKRWTVVVLISKDAATLLKHVQSGFVSAGVPARQVLCWPFFWPLSTGSRTYMNGEYLDV